MNSPRIKCARFSRAIVWGVIFVFAFGTMGPLPKVQAQESMMPVPGTMVRPSEMFAPAMMKGVKVFPENPFRFNFFMEQGEAGLAGEAVKDEYNKLIKYFLAALTVPEEDLWVNLSPYEADRVIPEKFGHTEMGRDLLAQDYLLKQLTATLMYPEDALGGEFWDRVHEEAYAKYGITDVPVDTFNKVWIVPETAEVYVYDNVAFVVASRLKVMLEEDYVAMSNNVGAGPRARPVKGQPQGAAPTYSNITTSIIRDIILPEIEQEVNEGANFTQLRQIYHSLILATWYKRNLKESFLGKNYVGQNKVNGVDIADKNANEKIYQQYLDAFKKGVYDTIREDYDPVTQTIVPRKYFSGGMALTGFSMMQYNETFVDLAKLTESINHDMDKVEAAVISSKGVEVAMVENDLSMASNIVELEGDRLETFLTAKDDWLEKVAPVVSDIQKNTNQLEEVLRNGEVKSKKGKIKSMAGAQTILLQKLMYIATSIQKDNVLVPLFNAINNNEMQAVTGLAFAMGVSQQTGSLQQSTWDVLSETSQKISLLTDSLQKIKKVILKKKSKEEIEQQLKKYETGKLKEHVDEMKAVLENYRELDIEGSVKASVNPSMMVNKQKEEAAQTTKLSAQKIDYKKKWVKGMKDDLKKVNVLMLGLEEMLETSDVDGPEISYQIDQIVKVMGIVPKRWYGLSAQGEDFNALQNTFVRILPRRKESIISWFVMVKLDIEEQKDKEKKNKKILIDNINNFKRGLPKLRQPLNDINKIKKIVLGVIKSSDAGNVAYWNIPASLKLSSEAETSANFLMMVKKKDEKGEYWEFTGQKRRDFFKVMNEWLNGGMRDLVKNIELSVHQLRAAYEKKENNKTVKERATTLGDQFEQFRVILKNKQLEKGFEDFDPVYNALAVFNTADNPENIASDFVNPIVSLSWLLNVIEAHADLTEELLTKVSEASEKLTGLINDFDKIKRVIIREWHEHLLDEDDIPQVFKYLDIPKSVELSEDDSMITNKTGGIDFNPAGLDLQTSGDAVGFDWPEGFVPCLDEDDAGCTPNIDLQQPLNGLTPFIFQITPVPAAELPIILGRDN